MKGQLRWLFGTRSAGGFYRARDYYSGINGCLHGYMIRNRERKGLESAFAMYGDCPAAARTRIHPSHRQSLDNVFERAALALVQYYLRC